VLEGELVIPVEGSLSFDALQMRLHPAESRIRKLADKTPAVLVAFDCLLRDPRRPLLPRPFEERRAALEELLAREPRGLSLTPFTRDVRKAKAWLSRRQLALDGVVAKRLDLPYRPAGRSHERPVQPGLLIPGLLTHESDRSADGAFARHRACRSAHNRLGGIGVVGDA
jgi:ATP-dependent DNA ligase